MNSPLKPPQDASPDSPASLPKRLGWANIVIPVLLCSYFLVGLATKELNKYSPFDPYPLFHWSLFAYPLEVVDEFEVYLYEMDGQRYDPPVRLQETEAYQEKIAFDPNQYHTLKVDRQLGLAVKQGKDAKAARLETLLEDNFVPGARAHYGVFEVTYSIAERLETGEVIEIEHVGDFYKGEQ